MKYLFPVSLTLSLLLSGCGDPPCEMPAKNAERYLVIDTVGGLGNRVNAIASGAAVAKLTGRKLVLWWDPIPDELPATYHDLFEGNLLHLEDAPLPKGWQLMDILDRKVGCDCIVKRWSFDKDKYEDLPALLESDTQYAVVRHIFPFGTKSEPKESLQEIIREMQEIKPVAAIDNAIAAFREKHFLNKHVVGIHFRAKTLSADFFGINGPNFDIYVEKMKEAISENQETVFFIASDNLDITRRFQSTFPGKVYSYPFFDIARGTVEDMQNAVIDWALLGHCDYIIGSNISTFSISAALRTRQLRGIAVGPADKTGYGQLYCVDKNGFIDESKWHIPGSCEAFYP